MVLAVPNGAIAEPLLIIVELDARLIAPRLSPQILNVDLPKKQNAPIHNAALNGDGAVIPLTIVALDVNPVLENAVLIPATLFPQTTNAALE